MFFESWSDFIQMGGYGFYVWLAYGISLLSILVLALQSLWGRNSVLIEVRRDEQRAARLKQSMKGDTL